MENYTKSMESACTLTKNMEVFFSSSSASILDRKACSYISLTEFTVLSVDSLL